MIPFAGTHKGEQHRIYGIRVFDLAVDQICLLLEKPDAPNGIIILS